MIVASASLAGWAAPLRPQGFAAVGAELFVTPVDGCLPFSSLGPWVAVGARADLGPAVGAFVDVHSSLVRRVPLVCDLGGQANGVASLGVDVGTRSVRGGVYGAVGLGWPELGVRLTLTPIQLGRTRHGVDVRAAWLGAARRVVVAAYTLAWGSVREDGAGDAR